jgi:uncharacterized membrane protein YoaK (UPF0700 family)
MRRFRFLTHRHRAPSTNRALGLLLASNAGAVNAGGFLVLHMHTSHMTGFASQLSDGLVTGNMKLLLSFTMGLQNAVASKTSGGIIGAPGFKYVGFVCVIPLAALLMALSVPPLLDDLARTGRAPSRTAAR